MSFYAIIDDGRASNTQTGSAVEALPSSLLGTTHECLENVKEHFGARRFAKFIYMTLTNALKRDLLENLYVLI